jgi:acyl dehydratase
MAQYSLARRILVSDRLKTPTSLDEIGALVGKELGPTDWELVDQSRVNAFAEVTDDFQWIHVDPERATASPLGGTIAHGLFTLSIGPKLASELISFGAFSRSINYGYDRVRFPAPLPVGKRVRMRLTVNDVHDAPGGLQVTITQTFEAEDAAKPVCVATSLVRLYDGQ